MDRGQDLIILTVHTWLFVRVLWSSATVRAATQTTNSTVSSASEGKCPWVSRVPVETRLISARVRPAHR
jgi:hypothetical protein